MHDLLDLLVVCNKSYNPHLPLTPGTLYRGLANTPGLNVRGWLAWIMWRGVYLTKLVSLRNKTRVLLDWMYTSIWGRDSASF